MSSDRDTDLSVLSRRGTLGETEARRLRELLQSSDEARCLHDAGLGLDEETPVLPGDDARIERIMRRVQAARRPARGVVRGRGVRAAAALLLAAGVAVAGVATKRVIWPNDGDRAATRAPKEAPPTQAPRGLSTAGERREGVPPAAPTIDEQPPALALPAPPRATQVERERARGLVPEHANPPPTFESKAPTGTVPSPTARFEELPPAATTTQPEAATADALFVAANRERVRGNAVGAIALYERLRAEFPRSTEAAACNVTLGVLYLQLARPQRALEAFKRSPATAEALWGQAQALRQLGRADEERLVLQDIVRRHGGSAYAPAAQKRLAELN